MQKEILGPSMNSVSLETEKEKGLEQIRQVVNALESIPCDLKHETVILEGGRASRRSQGIGLEPVLVRCGLCPTIKRASQLSCAHTGARLKLEHAVDAMVEQRILDPASATEIKMTLHQIAVEIYRIDMDMNTTQSDYAALVERNGMSSKAKDSKIVVCEEMIHKLRSQHRHAANELQEVKNILLKCFAKSDPT